jgi:hypothetical protein
MVMAFVKAKSGQRDKFCLIKRNQIRIKLGLNLQNLANHEKISQSRFWMTTGGKRNWPRPVLAGWLPKTGKTAMAGLACPRGFCANLIGNSSVLVGNLCVE